MFAVNKVNLSIILTDVKENEPDIRTQGFGASFSCNGVPLRHDLYGAEELGMGSSLRFSQPCSSGETSSRAIGTSGSTCQVACTPNASVCASRMSTSRFYLGNAPFHGE